MKNYLRILSYLRLYKGIIFLTWLISILVLILQGISVWIGAGFIQKILSGQYLNVGVYEIGKLASFMDRIADRILRQSTPFRSLLIGVLVLLLAAVLTTGFRVFKTFLFSRIIQKVLIKIRSEMFTHLTHLDLSFSRKYRAGEVTSLFFQETKLIQTAIIDAMDRVFMQPIRLLMALALMFSLSAELTWYALAFLAVTSFFTHLAGNRIEIIAQELMEKIAKVQGHLTEYLSQVIVARSMGKEEYEIHRFLNENRSLAKTAIRYSVVNSLAPQLITNLFVLAGGALLLIGGYRVFVNQTLPGDALIKMILLLPVASYPMEALASLYLSVRESLAGAKRIFGLLDEEGSSKDAADAVQAPLFKSEIELKNVTYAVEGHTILRDISFTIPRQKKIVIYGPSGAGKTTLLSLLAGFIRPSQGSILMDGTDIRKFKGKSWRQSLGIVIQEPILLNTTVRENLLYACPEADEEKLMRVLRQSLLWNEKCVFSLGLDTPVGNRGEFISGGERQRLTIARALLNSPSIFLMDEPTAMLDLENKKKIRDIICSLAKEATLIIASHDQFLREIADIEIKIESGRLVS